MSYVDLKKTKGRYDGACQEVESRRKKTETSFDYGKNKAQSAYQQQIMEMHNVKVRPYLEIYLQRGFLLTGRPRIPILSTSMLQISRKRNTTMSTFPIC